MSDGQAKLFWTGSPKERREARAARRLRREKQVYAMNLKRAQPKPIRELDIEPEFHLTGEDRIHTVFGEPCPECGRGGQQDMIVEHARDIVNFDRPRRRFRVQCRNKDCNHSTEWCDDSKKAYDVWQLAAKLAKL